MSNKKARAFVARVMENHDSQDVAADYICALVEQFANHVNSGGELYDGVKKILEEAGVTAEQFADWIEPHNIEPEDVQYTDNPYGPPITYLLAARPVGEWYEHVQDDELKHLGITRKQLNRAFDRAGWHVNDDNSAVLGTDRSFYIEITQELAQECASFVSRYLWKH